MKIFDWFKKEPPKKKDMSDFPTREQRIENAQKRIAMLKRRIRQLRETESNPDKLQELQAAVIKKQAELKALED